MSEEAKTEGTNTVTPETAAQIITPSVSPPVPPPKIELKLQLTPDEYSAFMRGDPLPIVQMLRNTCPKPRPRLYGSWTNIQKKKKKVAIVGFADSKDEAPYKDDEWEIWGLNSLFENIPMDHVTRWFEIHDRRAYNMDTDKNIGLGLTRDGKPYMEALTKLPCPVYMIEDYPDIPNCVRYPLEEMINAFAPDGLQKEWKEHFKSSAELDWNGYFTNSISYMIALATYEKYEEIGIWGVDMATGGFDTPNGEYAHQRPSCEYYIGCAVGRHIKVTIPKTADLLKTRFIYGPEMLPDMVWSAKLNKTMKSMNDRLVVAQNNKAFAQKQEDQYIGAIEGFKEMHKIWGTVNYPIKFYEALQKLIDCNPELQKLI